MPQDVHIEQVPVSTSDVNKDWTCKDKDMDKDQAYKDQDKDKDLTCKDKDKDKDLTCKDKDKDKDLTHKDQDKDKNLNLVLKESLRTRIRTSLTVAYFYLYEVINVLIY